MEEFDGLPPSVLQEMWLEVKHPELVGKEDKEDEVWELWSDAYGEVVEKHLAELLSTEPLSPAVVQARKESEAKVMEVMNRAIQQIKEKQTT